MTRSVWRGLQRDAVVLPGVMLLSVVGVAPLLRVGWVPSDEGTLAASAFRVFSGQVPHRDFVEIYTGGLSLLHAGAFHLFGTTLFSLRIAVFTFFLAWVPVVYFIARRFLGPSGAGLATLTAVSWSYPNYVAAMPSWYNLFLATFGVACAMRYIDVRLRVWLFLAGVCGGASVLVKVTGLYYVAAMLFFLLFLEQEGREQRETNRGCGLYRAFGGLGLMIYLAALTGVVLPQLHAGEAYQFLLPSVCCAMVLVWRERAPGRAGTWSRFASLWSMLGPFLAGIALVSAAFLVPYAATGSVGLAAHGVVSSALGRAVDLAGRAGAPGPGYICYGLVTAALMLLGMYSDAARRRWVAGAVAAGLAAVLACSAIPHDLQDTWMMAGMATPLVVLLGAAMIVAGPRWGAQSALAGQRMMLLICAAAMCSLVQYPVSYVTYFCYTAPLTLLATVGVVAARRDPPGRLVPATLLIFFLGMGWLGMVTKHVYNPALRPGDVHALGLARAGGLRVDATTPGYEELIPFLQTHSANGVMYAGNDCPELYFLTGLKNPTLDDTGAPEADVIAALRSGRVGVVAINDEPLYARGRVSDALRAEVERVLPHQRKMGRFSLYWR